MVLPGGFSGWYLFNIEPLTLIIFLSEFKFENRQDTEELGERPGLVDHL